MVGTETLKERDSLAANAVCSVSLNSTTATTGSVDMSKFFRVQFLGVGAAGATGTITSYIIESANSNMAGNTNVNGTTITSIVNGANQQWGMELNATQLLATSRYVAGVVTETQGIAKIVSLIPVATGGRYPPVNNNDAGQVNTRVVCNN